MLSRSCSSSRQVLATMLDSPPGYEGMDLLLNDVCCCSVRLVCVGPGALGLVSWEGKVDRIVVTLEYSFGCS